METAPFYLATAALATQRGRGADGHTCCNDPLLLLLLTFLEEECANLNGNNDEFAQMEKERKTKMFPNGNVANHGADSAWPSTNSTQISPMCPVTESSSSRVFSATLPTSRRKMSSPGVLDASLSQSRQVLLRLGNEDLANNSGKNERSGREGLNRTTVAKEPSVTRIRLRGRDLYSGRLRYGGSAGPDRLSTAQALRTANRLLHQSNAATPYSVQMSSKNRRRAAINSSSLSTVNNDSAARNSASTESLPWTSTLERNDDDLGHSTLEGAADQEKHQQGISETAKVILETLNKMNKDDGYSLNESFKNNTDSEPILMSRAEKRRRLAQELLEAASSSSSLNSSALRLSSSSSFMRGPPLRTAFSVSAGTPLGVRLKRRAPTKATSTETSPTTSSSSSKAADDGVGVANFPSSDPMFLVSSQKTTVASSGTLSQFKDDREDVNDVNLVAKTGGGKIRSRLGDRGRAREEARLTHGSEGVENEIYGETTLESLANVESKSLFGAIKNLPNFNFDQAHALSSEPPQIVKHKANESNRRRKSEEKVGDHQNILTSKQLNVSPPTSEGQEDVSGNLFFATAQSAKRTKKIEEPITTDAISNSRNDTVMPKSDEVAHQQREVYPFSHGLVLTNSGTALQASSDEGNTSVNFTFGEAQVIYDDGSHRLTHGGRQEKPVTNNEDSFIFKKNIKPAKEAVLATREETPTFLFGKASTDVTALVGQAKPLKQGSVMDILGKGKGGAQLSSNNLSGSQ